METRRVPQSSLAKWDKKIGSCDSMVELRVVSEVPVRPHDVQKSGGGCGESRLLDLGLHQRPAHMDVSGNTANVASSTTAANI
jgi:hypothetical protein